MKALSKHQRLRLPIQLVSLFVSVVFITLIILGFKHAIHALCPYAIVCFGISKAGLVLVLRNSFAISTAFSIGILIFTIFCGRKFCAYLCPIGTIQEAIFSVHSNKYYRRKRLSYFYESKLSRIKYFVLAITLILSVLGLGYIFIKLCPMYALSMLPFLAIPGLLIFVIIAVSAYISDRFWCRFLCPYAALMNIAQHLGNLFGIKRLVIRRNLERCIDCGICMQHCPMNINISETEFVLSPECIHCMKCADKCPKPGTFCCDRED